MKISTAPRPMAPTPKRTAEAVATRLAAAVWAAERARARMADRRRLAHSYSTAKHGQRESYHYKARPRCHEQHHADGEDHRARDGDRDPAEQPNQVLHIRKHASALTTMGNREHGEVPVSCVIACVPARPAAMTQTRLAR